MQLHEVFARDDESTPPTKAVKFRAMAPARASNAPPPKPREVEAVFVIVDEPETSAALRDAEVALIESHRDKAGVPIPILPSARAREQNYHFLFRALRDPAKPNQGIVRTVLELRRAIEPSTCQRLISSYNKWIDDEFPDTLTAEQFEGAVDDAEGK